jgi:hypothetical protein
MPYKQVKAFDQNKAGKRAGYCLANVRSGYGITAILPTARAAWEATQQHRDRAIPGGDVPLFYTYKADGHVNVRLADGRVWSDGNIYASLTDYEGKHPAVHYLGWGESLNGVRVIGYVPDPAPTPASPVTGKHITIPADSGSWHLYHEAGPYTVDSGKWVTILHPSSNPGGYTYPIVADKGNGIVVIQSPRWGRGALYTNGSKFTVK